MFGVGFGELVVIALALLIAVGPDRMPTFIRALGRAVREFRRATNELRDAVGLDDLLYDEPAPPSPTAPSPATPVEPYRKEEEPCPQPSSPREPS